MRTLLILFLLHFKVFCVIIIIEKFDFFKQSEHFLLSFTAVSLFDFFCWQSGKYYFVLGES